MHSSGGRALRITAAAVLVALTCIPAAMPSVAPHFKFVGFTVILSGLLLGPATGALVGGVSDVIGWLIHPVGGFFFPGFTLTQALTGYIPAALVGSRRPTFWLLLGAIAVGQLVTSVVLVSLFVSYLRGTPVQAELVYRFSAQALHVPVYAWAALAVLRALERHPTLWARLCAARR